MNDTEQTRPRQDAPDDAHMPDRTNTQRLRADVPKEGHAAALVAAWEAGHAAHAAPIRRDFVFGCFTRPQDAPFRPDQRARGGLLQIPAITSDALIAAVAVSSAASLGDGRGDDDGRRHRNRYMGGRNTRSYGLDRAGDLAASG